MLRKLELIFDFRHCDISHVPLSIDNSIVEICDNFKYLGTRKIPVRWPGQCYGFALSLIFKYCGGI